MFSRKKKQPIDPLLVQRDNDPLLRNDASSMARSTRKPATRKELAQRMRVKKQEADRRANHEKNRARVRSGKPIKPDDGTVIKKSIWERMVEERVAHELREMGDTTRSIIKFQKKRMVFCLFLILIGCAAGRFVHVWLYLSGPALAAMFYKMQSKRVDTFYRGWKFQRQLNFSKFTRLVIPYLKASGGTTALYTIFNKILQRTEDEADKRSLYQLMGEMGDNPQDITPFLAYAERSSGTDMSYLFMSTIFDFQQSTFDVSVIDELGKMASEDMMNAIDEIIAMKLRRFVMFPTKVVMSSFILVAGLGVGLMIDNFKNLDFSGNMMNPTSQVKNAGEKAKTDAATTKNETKETQKNDAGSSESESADSSSSHVDKGYLASDPNRPKTATIKADGKTHRYYLPGDGSYDSIKLGADSADRYFSSESDAQAAGFSRADSTVSPKSDSDSSDSADFNSDETKASNDEGDGSVNTATSNELGSKTAKKGYDIKGDVSKNGSNIYYLPDSSKYKSIKMDADQGDRYFKSTDDAARAGFVPEERSVSKTGVAISGNSDGEGVTWFSPSAKKIPSDYKIKAVGRTKTYVSPGQPGYASLELTKAGGDRYYKRAVDAKDDGFKAQK